MDPIGLTILIVVLLFFAVMAVVAVIWSQQNQWPEGDRYEGSFRAYKVTVVLSPAARADLFADSGKLDPAKMAERYAMAVEASATAWYMKKRKEALGLLEETVVYVMQNDEMQEWAWWTPRTLSATLDRVPRRIGQGPFMFRLNADRAIPAMISGEPIIHECMHALLGEFGVVKGRGVDRQHEDKTVWYEHKPRDPESVQAIAQMRYQTLLRDEVGAITLM